MSKSKKSPRRKRRRLSQPKNPRVASAASPSLCLENLEPRVLLDVAGFFDELGLSGASGGGITHDQSQEPGEVQLVQSGDSDPVAIWVDGTVNEFVDTPITFDFRATGNIYARQYGGPVLGWWDLTPGGGDTNPIGTGSQISAAAGPNGEIVVVWVASVTPPEEDLNHLGSDTEIYARMFDGTDWVELSGSATGGGLSNDDVLNEKPDVAISDGGEIFVSYTAVHPISGQREIVVKEYSFDLGNNKLTGAVAPTNLVWSELVSEDVGQFGQSFTSGVSNDLALSFDSAIAIDLDGKPIVAWTSLLNQDQAEIYVKKWDSDSWKELGRDGASNSDNDSFSGVSSDASMSIQPDIAVTNDGEIIITWVGWNNWQNYTSDGQAAIYVKSLQSRDIEVISSGVWSAFDTGTATGAGIAPQLAWYFNPQIDTDSQGNPLIGYQGYEERFAINRDFPTADTPGLPGNANNESPRMAVYASYFNGTNFQTLSDNDRNTAGPEFNITWMPNVLVGPKNELILGFTWHDVTADIFHRDDELFVQQWDKSNNTWIAYGRGSNINGNDVIGGFLTGQDAHNKLALIDFDNNPVTEPDVVLAKPNLTASPPSNNGQIFRYSRQTGSWSTDADLGIGQVFDIRSEPEVEFNVPGNALVAFLDDTTQLPMVYQWSSGQWNQVGAGAASALPGNPWSGLTEDWGISVQAGSDGQIFLAYLRDNGTVDEVVTRLWDPAKGVWADAGGGTATIGAPLAPVYFSNFDGVEFTDFNFSTLTLADALDTLGRDPIPDPPGGDDLFDGTRTPLVLQSLVRGAWNFDTDPNDTNLSVFTQFRDLIGGDANADAGITGTGDPGFLITFTDQEDDDDATDNTLDDFNDPATLEVFDVGPIVLAGELQNSFELIADSHLNIELSYQLETTPDSTGKLDLFLVIDNTVIDTVVGGAVDPISTIPIANGAGTYTTVTFDTKDLGLTEFTQGLHTMAFRAEYTSTGTANGTGDTDQVNAKVRMDNIAVYQRVVGSGPGSSTWEILDADTAGNGGVGPGTPPAFDFQADIHASLAGAGTQIYTIEDVTQTATGDMGISFRYRIDGTNQFTIKIDGTAYDLEGKPNPITADRQGAWWNFNNNDPEYTLVQLTAPNITEGKHTVTIEITSTGPAADLRIDNLTILATAKTDAVNPIATLIPTGGGQKNFALGITAKAASLSVYATPEQDPDGATDPFPDGTIASFASEFGNAYYTPNIFTLDSAANTWGRFGVVFNNTVPIDFLGVGVTSSMPTSTVYRLEDIAIGPNAFPWMALQHATTEWVDSSVGVIDPPDGINDLFDIHPFDPVGDRPERWQVNNTLMDVEVWRWQPAVDPLSGDKADWVQTFGSDLDNETIGHPRTETRAYSNPKLTGSNGQLPTLAWNTRSNGGVFVGAGIQRFQLNGTWGTLGPVIGQDADGKDISSESVQNTQFWSAPEVKDLIVNSNGFPIVAYNLGQLATDAVREFRLESTLPDMRITENTGFANDNRLDFGDKVTEVVDRAFTINNDGPDDLLIYSLQIGGIGTLATNPFSLGDNTPDFPITVKPGQTNAVSINVRFDPKGVPTGEYSAVLLINDSDPQHPTHEFSHFYEMNLNVEVLNEAEINVTPDFLTFADTSIDPANNTSPAESIIITNEGKDDSILRIDQWYFSGSNYRIVSATQTDALTNTPVSVGLSNDANDASDDVQLAFNDTLKIEIVFEPDQVEVANEIFFIASDDSDEPLTSVFLTGLSVNGAAITVEQTGPPIISVTDEGTIDFGSVITGSSDTININIRNTGSTDLTLFEVVVGIDVTVPLVKNIVVASGGTFLLPVTFAPTLDPDNPNDPVALKDSILIVSDDPDSQDQQFEINFIGLAVPEVPLISTTPIGLTTEPLSSLDFGSVPANTSPALTRSFQINNIGGADLTITSFTILPAFFDDGAVLNPFSVSPDLTNANLNIAVGDPAEVITVTFNPTFAGSFPSILNIASTGANKTIAQISLLGSVTNPLLEVSDSKDSATDQKIDFGMVGENFISSTETITLRNTGDSNLTITNWAIADPDNAFTITPFTTALTLAPNATHDIEVFFAPNTSPANFQATVTISSNDPGNLTTNVDLVGTGILPGDVGLSPLSLDFVLPNGDPLIARHDSALQTFTITNTGGSDLTLKGLVIVGQKFPDPADENELFTSPFNLSIIDSQAGLTRNRLDPGDATDDILLEPNDQQIVSVIFAPGNPFNNTVFAKMITTDQANGPESVRYVDLSGESIVAIEVGNLKGLNIRSRPFVDFDGDLVQVKLTGGGHALVVLKNGFGNGSDIARIELIDTSDKSNLTVSTKGQAFLGQIIGGPVKNITLKNVILDGDMDNDNVEDNDYAIDLTSLSGSLKLGDITNGADIRIADTSAKSGVKITAADIDPNTEVQVNGDVKLFQAANFRNGKFSAGNAKSIKITGSQALDSDFIIDDLLSNFSAAKAKFTGALRAQTLSKASILDVENAAISLRNGLGSLAIRNNLTNSLVLAGFDLGLDGRLGGGDDTLFGNSLIGSVKVRGVVDDTFIAAGLASNNGDFFHPTSVLPGSIKQVQFGSVGSPDGTPFGVAASTSISSVKVGGKSLVPVPNSDGFQVQFS